MKKKLSTFLSRKVYIFPVWLLLLVVTAGSALAIWLTMITSSGNTLGIIAAEPLRYSPDKVSGWSSTVPTLFSNTSLMPGETVTTHYFLRVGEAAAGRVAFTIDEESYTDGPDTGAAHTQSMASVIEVTQLRWGPDGSMVDRLTSDWVDNNSNGIFDLEDAMLALNDDASEINLAVNGTNVVYELQMTYTIPADILTRDAGEFLGDNLVIAQNYELWQD